MKCRAPAPVDIISAGTLAFCLAVFAAVAGCAAPGEPSPPHPVIPTTVADLSARQSGDSAVLSFTMPKQSTEHEALAETPAVEIDRAELAPGAAPARDTTWRQVYAVPSSSADSYVNAGRFDFRDVLSANELSRAPGSVLAYRVRTRASKRRASANSNIATLPIYAAPPVPQNLQATLTESAIVLTWQEPPTPVSDAGYRVYRAIAKPGEEAAAPAGPALDAELQFLTMVPPGSLTFRDMQFTFGETYWYVVRAVAQYEAVTVESEDSSSVAIAARDIFPPAKPTGLEAAIIAATSQAPLHVEVSWAISTEPDLAGYRVYRSETAEGVGERIGPQLLRVPAFQDNSVMPGGHYFYRVAAVDQAGNESAPSDALPVDVPQNTR